MKGIIMNSNAPTPTDATAHRVEFFRLPAPGKRDPFFGLSRGWYYKAAAHGEIKMIALRQRNALRGVRLIIYDSVRDYIYRAAKAGQPCDTAEQGLR
jgi:hypothetical protein